MPRLAFVCAVVALLAQGLSAQEVRYTSARSVGPAIRLVAEDARSQTYEVTTDWSVPLADALAQSGGDPVLLGQIAGAGLPETYATVALQSSVPPAVAVVAFEGEEVALSGASAEALAALDRPLAEVVDAGVSRRQLVGSLVVRLVRVEGDRLVRARRVVVRVPRPVVSARLAARGGANAQVAVERSVLADGTWFKIPISETGVYRIDAAYLRDSLEVEGVSLQSVQVYGNGGRILPAPNAAPRPADLTEVPTRVQGDALLFFAEAPEWWDWVPGAGNREGYWSHDISPFSKVSYYFVRVDAPAPKRLGDAAFPGWPDARPLAAIEDRHFYERDLLNFDRSGSGSGLDWLGPQLTQSGSAVTVLDTIPPGFTASTPVRYRTRVGARANPRVTITMSQGGQAVATLSPPAVSLSSSNNGNLINDAEASAERTGQSTLAVSFRSAGGNNGALSWLDWVEAVAEHPAVAGPRRYVSFPTPGGERGRFEVSLAGFSAAPEVWDVTEPGTIRRLGVQAAGDAFRVQVEAADSLRPREVVAFDPAGPAVRRPRAGERVPTQNLHGLAGFPDYVIVAHPLFLAQAQRLADYRRQRDGLAPVVVTTQQVYNEFASGAPDMRAVRDYMKFLYDRAAADGERPRYLLLFGDGHYDYRNITSAVPNFVPPYESENMFSETFSYTSDDYFGLLDDDEGEWAISTREERVDVGIGRIPARTPQDASAVVSKIFRYEDPATLGDWRSRFTFVGDDQYPNSWDRDLHTFNSDETANRTLDQDPTVSIRKIFGPAYPLVITARGRQRPQVTEAVRQSINEGTLIWNYSGHGGPDGLGAEGYMTPELAQSLNNPDRLPIFITATCSFGKYDIPDDQSLAEQLFLRPSGGGVAMFTTVRLVYTGSSPEADNNFGLNIQLMRNMLVREGGGLEGRPRRLGDILRDTKNTPQGLSFNNRKFNLLGDPAMRLGLPQRRLEVTASPTLTAFEEATVSGQVLGADGRPDPTFAGEVDVTVFDAQREITLEEGACCYTDDDNDGRGDYTDRTDRIYSGRASVSGGTFSTTFRVPQDVSYSGEAAKVVAYATASGGLDGVGQTQDVIVSAQAGARPNDAAGPEIRLFLNDSTFVDGGTTVPGGVVVARLRDESGINTVGAGVGHELLLTFDGDAASAIDVGPFYSGDLNTYRSGEVRVPLPELAPGEHTLRLTVWDALNNSSTAELRFVVIDEGLLVENLFPYPNPTAGPTRFTFDHNQPPGTPATAQLRIYTLAGRPIRTIDGAEALPDGVLPSRTVQIPWDGLDDDLDRLASGVYLFRLRLEVPDPAGGSRVAERVERLAIIR